MHFHLLRSDLLYPLVFIPFLPMSHTWSGGLWFPSLSLIYIFRVIAFRANDANLMRKLFIISGKLPEKTNATVLVTRPLIPLSKALNVSKHANVLATLPRFNRLDWGNGELALATKKSKFIFHYVRFCEHDISRELTACVSLIKGKLLARKG